MRVLLSVVEFSARKKTVFFLVAFQLERKERRKMDDDTDLLQPGAQDEDFSLPKGKKK